MTKAQGICLNGLVMNSRGEILLVKRSLEDDAFPGNWELPGGGIEYGESAEESLKRELQEECGLLVDVFHPLTINMFYFKDKQYFEITFLCKVTDDSYDITLSDEHTEHRWISFTDLNSLQISDYMRQTLTNAEKTLHLPTP